VSLDQRTELRGGFFPWRRHYVDARIAPVLTEFLSHHPRQDTSDIERSFRVADEAHRRQVRRTGASYISHPVEVAHIVAKLGLDAEAIIAAMLHDTVEDTTLTSQDIHDGFGDDVGHLVDGLTKLDRLRFKTKEDQQSATIRKMVVAMARDVRVLVIKLCDRLHNMRTLGALPEAKRRQIATETMTVYAPLANRFGIQDVRWQLEDLCFATLHPARYAEVDQLVMMRRPQREQTLRSIISSVEDRLGELNIRAEVTGRPKNVWSIYEKMRTKGKRFEEIYDLVGIRIITENVRDCYAALGCIHAYWRPVPGRFKDYIADPKFNLYQSLHTAVVDSSGKPIEIQIRTGEMHARAEKGIAAHWAYKADAGPSKVDEAAWMQRILDWHQNEDDPTAFMAVLKTELVDDEEVFVITPKGDVHTLPAGSTAVDFAYAVHTEIGHRCVGARINGKIATLRTVLQSGDQVEIFTRRGGEGGPSRDWLRFVRTPKAKAKIRHWFSKEERDDKIERGAAMLVKAFRRVDLPAQKIVSTNLINEVAGQLNYHDGDALFIAVAEGHLTTQSVVQRARKVLGLTEPAPTRPSSSPHRRPSARQAGGQDGPKVEGLDGIEYRFARCCNPVTGDDITGYVTLGRGVSIHRSDCANLARSNPDGERAYPAQWATDEGGLFVVSIRVEAIDRPRLLTEVADALSRQNANIISASTRTDDEGIATLYFEIELGDMELLDGVMDEVRGLDQVYEVTRSVHVSAG